MNKKLIAGIFALFIAVVLAACGGEGDSSSNEEDNSTENTEENEEGSNGDADHSDMDHSGSGEVPEDLDKAEDPTYSVGSKAKIRANHMKGMDGAVATIEGVYDTRAYEVTYKPHDGGEKVNNHKWVIHEEMENAQEQPYKKGEEVVLKADHMEGMKRAKATIDSSEDTTVYMVSYTDTETGEAVKNHKWVTEDELSTVE